MDRHSRRTGTPARSVSRGCRTAWFTRPRAGGARTWTGVCERGRGLNEGRRLASDGRRCRARVGRPTGQRPPSHPPSRLWRFGGQASSRSLQILYEDESLLVVNKPAGLLAVPLERREAPPRCTSASRDHLRSRGKRRPLIVHRIDRDTSGLVVFAKTARAQQALKSRFKRRKPERILSGTGVTVILSRPTGRGAIESYGTGRR